MADLQIGPVMESTRDVQLEIMYKKCCQGLSFEHSVLGTYPTVDLPTACALGAHTRCSPA